MPHRRPGYPPCGYSNIRVIYVKPAKEPGASLGAGTGPLFHCKQRRKTTTVVVAPRLVQRRFRIGGPFRTSGGMLLCHVGTPSQAERARGIVRMPSGSSSRSTTQVELVKVHDASMVLAFGTGLVLPGSRGLDGVEPSPGL